VSMPKLFTTDIPPIASFSFDETGEFFFTGGVSGGYGILLDPPFVPEFVLGLLNSRLLDFFLHSIGTQMRGGWYSYEARFIRRLPVRKLDPSDKSEAALHSELVKLVKRILKAKEVDQSADTENLEREIDERVYRLYGLTKDEIKVVEEGRG